MHLHEQRVRLGGLLAPVVVALATSLWIGCAGGSSPTQKSSFAVAPSASAKAKPAPVRVAFDVPRNDAPFDLRRTPWPSEMARLPGGHLDLRAYPGRGSALIEEYLRRAAEDLDGFSIAPVVFFRFEGPLDLPAFAADDSSRAITSSVLLVDVDDASPEKGTLYPIALHATERDMRYVQAGTLAVRPADGFTLRPATRYAALVKRSFGGVAGGLEVSPDLAAILSATPSVDADVERARALHAPALDALSSIGVARDEIAALAIFKTGNPERTHEKLVEVADSLFQKGAPHGTTKPPRVVSAEWDPSRGVPGLYRVLRGDYCTPSFQQKIENAPFLEREGGRVTQSADGRPIIVPVQRQIKGAKEVCPGQIRARFFLSVPERAAPADGYPLVVTAHGTFGSATSFLGEDDFAGWAALEGFAAVSTDQPLHGGELGGRPGAAGPLVLPMGISLPSSELSPPLVFYNPLYPGATIGNLTQAAADAAVLIRLFGGADFGALRNDSGKLLLKSSAGAPRLDARGTVLAGHSQGCQSLGVLGAIDPRVRAVLLSGCGGDARLGILYGRPIDEPIADWIALTLGLDPAELTPFHPLMALVQSLADRIDPLAYARRYRERSSPAILHIGGLRDRYTPPVSAEALAIALRARPLLPLIKKVPGLDLLGLEPWALSPDDLATRALPPRSFLQLSPKAGLDGHFVLYDIPVASLAFRSLLRAARP